MAAKPRKLPKVAGHFKEISKIWGEKKKVGGVTNNSEGEKGVRTQIKLTLILQGGEKGNYSFGGKKRVEKRNNSRKNGRCPVRKRSHGRKGQIRVD